MASGEQANSDVPENPAERGISALVNGSEFVMEFLELLTALVLVVLFAIGLYDLVVNIWAEIQSGGISQIDRVVDFIDTVLVLLIIVEVFRTVIAFSRDETIVRIIIDASLVAVARKVIGFRPDQYPTTTDLFINASAIAILLLSVIIAFYIIQRTTSLAAEGPNTPAAGTAGDDGGSDVDTGDTGDAAPPSGGSEEGPKRPEDG